MHREQSDEKRKGVNEERKVERKQGRESGIQENLYKGEMTQE